MKCKNNRALLKFKVKDVNFFTKGTCIFKEKSWASETHKVNLAACDSPVNINEKKL